MSEMDLFYMELNKKFINIQTVHVLMRTNYKVAFSYSSFSRLVLKLEFTDLTIFFFQFDACKWDTHNHGKKLAHILQVISQSTCENAQKMS